ncbi:SDR family NAD(P)-dependent oxidoreductase [Paenibacillus athensensis]|uniref:Short-chain dehydrogenase n=1 Tax=Paenibacillus athensensis TaxID=1967502 RepID=A0A4Y8Q4Q7_9BACL|nr:SDR family NAD(P)-dependent oxidoreductase [Paenibacillus athensensis]MCD1258449.1 SDR family NAD(P)-dependent oxidoreductase [Paenibacillus athensensis]
MNNNHSSAPAALITGASSGIGLELARKLLQEGWQVAALVRSDLPADDPLLRAKALEGQLRVYKADLADFSSLRAALAEIKHKETKLDALFNNAGGSFPQLLYSKQGRELHYELQTVVPYIILQELKPLLLAGARRTVVNTSSNVVVMVKAFDPATLAQPTSFKKLFGPYATTKLALSLWTEAIAPQLAAEGITVVSADPGGNNTLRKGNSSGLPVIVRAMMKLIFPPPGVGAARLFDAGFGEQRGRPGELLIKGKPTKLKFGQQGQRVLQLVDTIYRETYKDAKA